jgi:hypothetical protein
MTELGNRASEISALYDAEGIELHSNSGLAELITGALELASSSEIEGQDAKGDILLGLHLERVYKALMPLKGHTKRQHYLRKLCTGDLRFMNRTPAAARDSLFELEVWRSINELRSSAAELDEPDVVLSLPLMKVGIACKKIYSKLNFSKTLSNAVKQIRTNCPGLGIVAFSIDDLFPEGEGVGARTFDSASNFLSDQCQDFLAENERLFIKYFKGSDIVGALAVASTVVKITDEKPLYSNMQQWFLWSAPELNDNAQKAVIHLRKLIGKEKSA